MQMGARMVFGMLVLALRCSLAIVLMLTALCFAVRSCSLLRSRAHKAPWRSVACMVVGMQYAHVGSSIVVVTTACPTAGSSLATSAVGGLAQHRVCRKGRERAEQV